MELNISWVKPARSARSSGQAASGVRISNTRHSTKEGKDQSQTTVRLGVDVMKKCGLLLGDKVALGFADMSGKGVMVVRRVNDGSGYTLSNPRIKEYRGTNKSWGVAKMAELNVPQGEVSLGRCIIHDDMLIVPMEELK